MLKIIISILVIVLAQDVSYAENKNTLPVTCDGAIKNIYSQLKPEDIDYLKTIGEGDLIRFHITWGLGIRNSLKLWEEGSPIVKSCAKREPRSSHHPDDISMVIMEGVWQKINRK